MAYKKKSIILTHTIYCWLLLQIYPCYYDCVCAGRKTHCCECCDTKWPTVQKFSGNQSNVTGTILILYYLLIYYFNAIEKYFHNFFSGGGGWGGLNDNDLTLVTQQQHFFYVHTETDNILISLLTLETLAAFYANDDCLKMEKCTFQVFSSKFACL